jgi:O-antigen ligase
MQISSAQWFNMHGIAFFNYDDVHKVITNRDILFAWLFRQHETYYSFAYIFAFFLSIYYFLRRKTENRINIVDFIFGLILVILYSVFSHARIALVFIILAMALGFGYKLLNHKKLLVVLSVACAVAGTVCVIIFWDKFIFFISDGTRPTLFQIAWENICQRPFFGAGLGGLKQIFTTAHSSAGIDINFTTIFHPHNQFLADWMQTGIFGLAIMLFIVIYTFYYAIKQRDFLIFVFMLMWLQMLLIESPMISERGVFYFVLPMCILMQRK